MRKTRQISHTEEYKILYVDILAFGRWDVAPHSVNVGWALWLPSKKEGEKPDKHPLGQVKKVNVTSGELYSQYIPLIWCDGNGTLKPSSQKPVIPGYSSPTMRKLLSPNEDHPTKYRLTSKTIKNKEDLTNCHSQEDSKTDTSLKCHVEAWVGSWNRKGIFVEKTKEIWMKHTNSLIVTYGPDQYVVLVREKKRCVYLCV